MRDCLVCSHTIDYVDRLCTITECGHNDVCSICFLRMRAIKNNNQCSMCKTVLERVICSDIDGNWSDYDIMNDSIGPGFLLDHKSNMFFPSTYFQTHIQQLFEWKCKQCNQNFRNSEDFQNHLRKVHKSKLCNLCVKNRDYFPSEHIVYTESEYVQHLVEGNKFGFLGHPSCALCGQRHYDRAELFKHLNKEHYSCDICEKSNSQYVFYNKYDDLERHFRTAHFICEEPECLMNRFVAFASQFDLNHHILRFHPNKAPNNRLTIPINFTSIRSENSISSSSFTDRNSKDRPYRKNNAGRDGTWTFEVRPMDPPRPSNTSMSQSTLSSASNSSSGEGFRPEDFPSMSGSPRSTNGTVLSTSSSYSSRSGNNGGGEFNSSLSSSSQDFPEIARWDRTPGANMGSDFAPHANSSGSIDVLMAKFGNVRIAKDKKKSKGKGDNNENNHNSHSNSGTVWGPSSASTSLAVLIHSGEVVVGSEEHKRLLKLEMEKNKLGSLNKPEPKSHKSSSKGKSGENFVPGAYSSSTDSSLLENSVTATPNDMSTNKKKMESSTSYSGSVAKALQSISSSSSASNRKKSSVVSIISNKNHSNASNTNKGDSDSNRQTLFASGNSEWKGSKNDVATNSKSTSNASVMSSRANVPTSIFSFHSNDYNEYDDDYENDDDNGEGYDDNQDYEDDIVDNKIIEQKQITSSSSTTLNQSYPVLGSVSASGNSNSNSNSNRSSSSAATTSAASSSTSRTPSNGPNNNSEINSRSKDYDWTSVSNNDKKNSSSSKKLSSEEDFPSLGGTSSDASPSLKGMVSSTPSTTTGTTSTTFSSNKGPKVAKARIQNDLLALTQKYGIRRFSGKK